MSNIDDMRMRAEWAIAFSGTFVSGMGISILELLAERDRMNAYAARLEAERAELLAACKDALEDGEQYRLSETVKRRLRSAIAKAEAQP